MSSDERGARFGLESGKSSIGSPSVHKGLGGFSGNKATAERPGMTQKGVEAGADH